MFATLHLRFRGLISADDILKVSLLIMQDGPLLSYRKRIELGKLKRDPAQRKLAESLQALHTALKDYQPNTEKIGWGEKLGLSRRQFEPLDGLYIYGGVGGGKSMLMDLFYDTAPIKLKRRVHFHEFLQDVHERFNSIRKAATKNFGDPIPIVAEQLAQESWLLCFDELQVYNIVDAVILGRLFEGLLSCGVVVVATSNRAPNDLYKNGLRRDKFLPFIELICERLEIHKLNSVTDYRLERMLGMQVYHHPLNRIAEKSLDKYFSELAGGRAPVSETIEIKGRPIKIATAAGIARKNFRELCGEPLGAADYLAIADRYHTLILDEIPCMGEELQSEAKRFVTLIDALYEAKVNLICSADAPPERLYVAGEGVFEFERLVSRLMEMQSADYLALPHGNSDSSSLGDLKRDSFRDKKL